MDTAFRHLLAVMVLSIGAVVGSFLDPPCMSPLGLELAVNEHSLTFELAASSGNANNIRLNGPRSWRPANVIGSFLEINISRPVLLTGLQVQGDPQQTGQIDGWLLDTSEDCETYLTENYFLDHFSPVYAQTIHLKSVQFVSCIRLRPTHFIGTSPALRLELLGCDWWRSNCGIKGGARDYRKKRVVSGQRNVPGEWPWLVSMHFSPPFSFTENSGFEHFCGASLIAPSWILTAAHCFVDTLLHDGLSDVSNWRIYLGMHDLARGDDPNFVQERLIDTVYVHPTYNQSINKILYDIALVKLNEPVDYSDRVSPVCLDDTDIHIYGEIPCYVSGWGHHFYGSPGDGFPYTAFVSTLSPASCQHKYDILPEGHPWKNRIRIKPPVLCADVGTNGEDACQEDSGGPLMCQHDGRWYQAGVVSGGYLCGNQATPGLYSRVSYFVHWIIETMEDHDGI